MKPKPKKPRKICLDKELGTHIEPSLFHTDMIILVCTKQYYEKRFALFDIEIKKLIPWLTNQQAYAKYLKR